jgi:hypothetical protein
MSVAAFFRQGSTRRSRVPLPAIRRETPGGMLTEEDDVEIHALAKRGWSISAIARHTGRD